MCPNFGCYVNPNSTFPHFSNAKNSYNNNEFPQLLGRTTTDDYNLAIHVLEKNNMYTVREIDAMITEQNEVTFE